MPGIAPEYDAALDVIELYNYGTTYTTKMIRSMYFGGDLGKELSDRQHEIIQSIQSIRGAQGTMTTLWGDILRMYNADYRDEDAKRGYVWLVD